MRGDREGEGSQPAALSSTCPAALGRCLLPQEDFAAIFKVWIVSYTPTLCGLEMM